MSNTHYPTTAERWSHSAWKRLSLTAPCDLREVCEFLRYGLKRDTLPPGFLGFFIRDGDGQQQVVVSESLPMIEQRQVIAHEIGHGLSSRKLPGVLEFRCSVYNRSEAAEREADMFARHLLIPSTQLVIAVEEFGSNAVKLAHHFGVSPEVVSTRLRECGLRHPRR